jgi:UDP-N-acetylglucosamine 2-epimerase (non-hydrolysing)
MSGLEPERMVDSVRVVTDQWAAAHAAGSNGPRVVPDYDTDDVSAKVVRIILSYTGYINRTVWRK